MNRSSTKSRFIIFNEHTIFEPIYPDETRSRKRARVEDDEEDNPLAGLFRDSQYYDAKSPDACTILAGNTLFRVQKNKFTKVCEVLDELVHSRTQTSDESPLSIVSEPEQFRAFLWAINASPEELKPPIVQLSQLEKLCNAVKFSLFYNCISLKSLGLSAILDAVKMDSFFGNCSSSTLHLLTETAAISEDAVLLDSVISGWIKRIQHHDAPCIPAILSADALNIPQLCGPACYGYLLELVEHSTTLSKEGVTQFRLDPKLSMTQKNRILAGHWSLEKYWNRFRVNPLDHLSCGHAKCLQTWECYWLIFAHSRKIRYANQTDVLGLMLTLHKLLSDELLDLMQPNCREKALDSMGEASEELYRNLGAHFAAF